MHNKWDISKIEAVIQELNKRLDYQCNLKIEISNVTFLNELLII